uniref:Uncharacterized protein n=1 Tax=mine drainage metagenome TaxID=410659 RepID=E6PSA4_9ZZZZ
MSIASGWELLVAIVAAAFWQAA